MKRKIKFEASITGFIIGLVIITFAMSSLLLFTTEMENEYSVTGTNSLSSYNKTAEMVEQTRKIRDNTNITQQEGLLDVIGGFFSSGYSSLKVAGSSINIYSEMMNDASGDVEAANTYNVLNMILTIVLIIIFVGVFIAVLVKMRI